MQVNTKRLKMLFQAVALVIFTVQMVYAFLKYSRKPTMSSPGTETLDTLETPILIAVCQLGQFHALNARHLGYSWSYNYFVGNSSRNDTWTWTGLYGNLTANETMNYIFKSNLENIQFYLTNASTSNRFLLPHGYCKVLEDDPKPLRIELQGTQNGKSPIFFLFVGDPTASPKFALPYFLMSGHNLEFEIDPHRSKFKDYNLKLKKTRVLTQAGSCIEYPTDNYENFAECIEDENQKKILPHLGCMVPWISWENQCEGHINRPKEQEKLSQWLNEVVEDAWAGFQYKSSCPLPCTITSVQAKYMETTTEEYSNKNGVFLYFENKVQVEIIVISFDFGDLLVEIGSSLGLWLGLSVVGIFDIVVAVVNKLNTFVNFKLSPQMKTESVKNTNQED